MGAVRRLIGGTTWRGRAFLVLGAALLVVGLVTAERQLVRLAVLALVLPVAGALTVGRASGRLRVTRSLDRPTVAPGEPSLLTLTVTNTGRLPVGEAVLAQPLAGEIVRVGSAGAATGARRRVGRLRPGERSSASLALTGTVRGHHRLPAAVVTVTDPFGMIRRTGTAVDATPGSRAADLLTVTPAVTRLTGALGRSPASGGQLERGRSVGVAGERDATVREYAAGDDVRRVHWRSTAHRGQLMVRQEDEPWNARVTVVLDTRSGAHALPRDAGTPLTVDTSSFEWAVAAAASVIRHAASLDHEVTLVADTRARPGRPGVQQAARAGGAAATTGVGRARVAALAANRLVDLPTRRAGRSERVTGPAARGGRGDVLVALLGAVGARDLPELAELRAGRSTAVALLLDVTTWPGTGAGTGPTGGVDDVRAALAAAGWLTAVARRGDDVAQVWAAAQATGRTGIGRTGTGRTGTGRTGIGRTNGGAPWPR